MYRPCSIVTSQCAQGTSLTRSCTSGGSAGRVALSFLGSALSFLGSALPSLLEKTRLGLMIDMLSFRGESVDAAPFVATPVRRGLVSLGVLASLVDEWWNDADRPFILGMLKESDRPTACFSAIASISTCPRCTPLSLCALCRILGVGQFSRLNHRSLLSNRSGLSRRDKSPSTSSLFPRSQSHTLRLRVYDLSLRSTKLKDAFHCGSRV
mmetsp:Transcript_2552/g.5159  ORF Transcript_2552/g.5159 Transcript_2552/m.5159 type:complete len:210 (+) Transcript_2552:183-812(+)